MDEQQQIQQQIEELVKAAMEGDEQATQAIQQIMQAAEQGDPQAQQIASMIQEVAQQYGAQSAKKGAKLNYINYLRGKCPEGYEIKYYKKGGNLCKACVKKKQKCEEGSKMSRPSNAVEAFKCGRQVKKKKAACGTKIDAKKGGGGMNGVPYTRKKIDAYNWVDTKRDSQGRTSTRTVTEDGTLYKGRNGRGGMEGTAVGDSIKNADWQKGQLVQEKVRNQGKAPIKKKANGGSFVPFTNRVPR